MGQKLIGCVVFSLPYFKTLIPLTGFPNNVCSGELITDTGTNENYAELHSGSAL